MILSTRSLVIRIARTRTMMPQARSSNHRAKPARRFASATGLLKRSRRSQSNKIHRFSAIFFSCSGSSVRRVDCAATSNRDAKSFDILSGDVCVGTNVDDIDSVRLGPKVSIVRAITPRATNVFPSPTSSATRKRGVGSCRKIDRRHNRRSTLKSFSRTILRLYRDVASFT